MHESYTIESTRKIEDNISSNLEAINEQSRNYVKDILILIKKEVGINKVLSILLFGSQRAKSEATAVSDCDLLIIFKNRVSNHHIKEIEKYFIALEIKHKFRSFDTKLPNKILGVIQQTTGIFVSHFLTKVKYWEKANFHKIFRVNKVFSAVFAPRNIVLGNVVSNSTILYGDNVIEKIKPKIQITFFEMIKSIIMNLMISFFSILISVFKNLEPTRYQLEAIKWALKASNFYCFRDTESLEAISERFISFERVRGQKSARRFFNTFLNLRKSPQNDMNFMIRCPIRIIKIHLRAILYKKLVIRRKKTRILTKIIEPIIQDRTFPLRI
ncbi:MAG: nucleotidyltransferase domain-containing protein [Candidatus Lokiarchaeota archaeon]|nr:nucleotidyltransferase domain-containing protein [Candidatus Lokiarchaeota archaeon]